MEPSAPAALTLTRRAPGATPRKPEASSSPAMMPATWVPCPKVSRWARCESRLWLEKSGPCTTLPAAASAGTGTMPVSITATSTPAPVPADCAPIAWRTSSSEVPGVAAVALEPLSAQPPMRPSPTTAATPVLGAQSALGAGGDLGDEAVDDRQRLADGAAAVLHGALRGREPVGLGAHDHGVHGDRRGSARDQQQCDHGQHGHQGGRHQQALTTIVFPIPTDSPDHVHVSSSVAPGAVRSAHRRPYRPAAWRN